MVMTTNLPECCDPAFVKGFSKTLYRAGYSEKQAAEAHRAVVVSEIRSEDPGLLRHVERALAGEATKRAIVNNAGDILAAIRSRAPR